MPSQEELRSVSDTYFNAYAWPLGAWAIGLLFLYAFDKTALALWLCYPLTLWYAGLTSAWSVGAMQRRRAGEISVDDALAGARSLGRFLAGASLAPAVVFMAINPLEPSTWGTCAGVGAVAGVAWVAANTLPRLRRRPATIAALVLSWAALPLNATGAVSLASTLGLFGPLFSR